MKIKITYIFLTTILFNFLFSYFNKDPLMVGLAGAYNTKASGYKSVGINPANLAFSNGISMNFMQFNFNYNNNFVTRERLNNLKGADLENETASNYFPKNEILNYLEGDPIKNNIILNVPFSFVCFSSNTFAINSEIRVFTDLELSQDFFKFALYGNEIDTLYNFKINSNSFVVMESSFSKGFRLGNLGLGFTLKYFKGLIGVSYLTIDNPEFITTSTQIQLSGSRYLLRQNTLGNGFGLDLGITSKRTDDGWKFGLSIIDLFSYLDWNYKTYIDEQFESFYDDFYNQTGIGYNESKLFSLSIDSLNLEDLNNDDVELGDLFIVQDTDVYESSFLPIQYESIEYEYSTVTKKYYIPTDSLCVGSENFDCDEKEELKKLEQNVIKFDYPTSLNFGFSKRVDERQMYILDISTGLDNSFNNKEKWRVSVGGEFGTQIFPFRLGFSYGGYDSISFGLGMSLRIPSNKGYFSFDIGLGFKGGDSLDSANGLDFGFGVNWIQN